MSHVGKYATEMELIKRLSVGFLFKWYKVNKNNTLVPLPW